VRRAAVNSQIKVVNGRRRRTDCRQRLGVEDMLVTPFAQILQSLRTVRDNYVNISRLLTAVEYEILCPLSVLYTRVPRTWWQFGLGLTDEVTVRPAGLVLRWVTVSGYAVSVLANPPRPTQLWSSLRGWA